jgi:hypothetical protein
MEGEYDLCTVAERGTEGEMVFYSIGKEKHGSDVG